MDREPVTATCSAPNTTSPSWVRSDKAGCVRNPWFPIVVVRATAIAERPTASTSRKIIMISRSMTFVSLRSCGRAGHAVSIDTTPSDTTWLPMLPAAVPRREQRSAPEPSRRCSIGWSGRGQPRRGGLPLRQVIMDYPPTGEGQNDDEMATADNPPHGKVGGQRLECKACRHRQQAESKNRNHGAGPSICGPPSTGCCRSHSMSST